VSEVEDWWVEVEIISLLTAKGGATTRGLRPCLPSESWIRDLLPLDFSRYSRSCLAPPALPCLRLASYPPTTSYSANKDHDQDFQTTRLQQLLHRTITTCDQHYHRTPPTRPRRAHCPSSHLAVPPAPSPVLQHIVPVRCIHHIIGTTANTLRTRPPSGPSTARTRPTFMVHLQRSCRIFRVISETSTADVQLHTRQDDLHQTSTT
jgi:hypothetical protein